MTTPSPMNCPSLSVPIHPAICFSKVVFSTSACPDEQCREASFQFQADRFADVTAIGRLPRDIFQGHLTQ